MKNRIISFLVFVKHKLLYENKVSPAIYRFLCKIHILQPYMIIWMDGGICSQMHQYLLGRYYAEKGMNVAYDTRFYRFNGLDKDFKFERKFEFQEMWPNLPIKIASDGMLKYYEKVLKVKRNGMHFPLTVEPPKYFEGYYFFDDEKEYAQLFGRFFSTSECSHLDKLNVFNNRGGVKCAVHVRRGDLAKMDDCFYGKVTLGYFQKAMAYIRSKFQGVSFFFFSDELDWVEQHLIQYCDEGEYELMKGNKAWEDLSLMAHCDCFISSQGSAGKVAAMMNGKGLLIIPNDPHDLKWKERYENVLVIDN